MSLIPVAAAWVGRYITYPGPEIFYLLVFIAWSLAYFYLSYAIVNQLKQMPIVIISKNNWCKTHWNAPNVFLLWLNVL
ncbi:hypothetical protein [Fructilactobacillus sanfranciscensis]|uniref:hypothetical protein n=1 Tax=Fructilactobacillus sanfranciscensis TaxID=1625 RepID=UPI000CD48C13|nr:hypothetical protein [Fructilactobacillus sanfranciscensis]POH22046.1 hypothetical protein BGL46_01270 [Fructilactobacillus sanfranciscensis]TNK98130.1 hypothetical protein DKP75_01145 [Fructilactobacillus sanfranciscensis]TNK99970.1 hypothetical protein DK130_01950 [Fructilactobacillus sanfranciscensis]TNL02088.1 hypothetical protein DOL84_00290 [Fructilactobacillus sanfranciscensis]